MITHDLNLLPLVMRRKVKFLGTVKCSEAEPQCISVGALDTGDLVLVNQDGHNFRIPADERLGVLQLIAQSVQQ